MAEIIKELKLRKANGEETSAQIMASYLGTEENNYTYIDIKNLLENNNTIVYGTCSSVPNSSIKVIILEDENIELKNNTIFCIKFTYTNSTIKTQFQINGATYPIVVSGQQITASSMTQYGGVAGSTLQYLFRDDTFIWIGGIDRDTDTNTDTKVTQTVTATNSEYPLLAKSSTEVSTITDTSRFASGVTLNPYYNRIQFSNDGTLIGHVMDSGFVFRNSDYTSFISSQVTEDGASLDVYDNSNSHVSIGQGSITATGTLRSTHLYINNSKVDDFVVSQGVSSITGWRYRVWKSGIKECWGTVSLSQAANTWTTWGGLYMSDYTSIVTYPVTFSSRPVEIAQAGESNSGYSAGLVPGGLNSTSACGKYQFSRGSQCTAAAELKVLIYAIGV